METIGKMIVGFILMIGTVLLEAFVLLKVWTWYLIPYLSAPEIPYIGAVGISLFAFFFKNHSITNENLEADWEESVGKTFILLLIYLTVWFVAWFIKLFV